MFRIDSSGATEDNKFTEGDPATGARATVVTDEWLNAVQEELANSIEADGQSLNKLDSGQLSKLFGRRVIFIGSIAEDIAGRVVIESQKISANGYQVGSESGGGPLLGRATLAKSLHNGITHFSPTVPPVSAQEGATDDERIDNYRAGAGETDPGGNGIFVRQEFDFLTPEMCGAVGDGLSVDTLSLKAFWTFPRVRKQARGSYLHSITDSTVTHTYSGSFFADLRGAKFLPQSAANYQLRVEVPLGQSSGVLAILGGETVGADLICKPLEIFGDGRVELLLVTKNVAKDLKETTQGSSVFGLLSQVKADSIQVYGNKYTDISRSSAGVISCQGISISNVDAICHVYGNTVERVEALSDIDADGIVVFSANRLDSPSEVQPVNVRVFNNRLVDCQGRFVKLQSPGKVYGNDFRSETLSLVNQFRAVDGQFGGVDCYDNDWRINGVTVGSDATFYYYQAKGDTGSEENTGLCRDNRIYTDVAIRYFAFMNVTGGSHAVNVYENRIKSSDGLSKIEDFSRFGLPATAAEFVRAEFRVSRNTFDIGDSGIVILTGGAFGEAAVNSKIMLDIADNRPVGLLAGGTILVKPAGITPYLGDFLISDNGPSSEAFSRIDAQGVSVKSLRGGNRFYYGTDGATGGLTDSPANYVQFVFVETGSDSKISLSKINADKFALSARDSATWYEYLGAAI